MARSIDIYLLESRYTGLKESPFVPWISFATKEKAVEYLTEYRAALDNKYINTLEYRIIPLAYCTET